MKRQIHNSYRVILLALLAVLVLGCNSFNTQPPVTPTDTANSQQLPFAETKPLVVPADTVVYVRLKQPLSAAEAEAGQDFHAVLIEPIVIENQVVVAQGADVVGKVVAARESGRLHRAGYVRIRLCSIAVNGRQVPLASNSVIAAGGNISKHALSVFAGLNSLRDTGNKEAGFTPEQRLAFRLTQPLSLSAN